MRIRPTWRAMNEAGTEPSTGGEPAAPATPPADTSAAPQDWTQSIDEGLREYVAKKGFKDPAEAVKALQENESRYAVPESVEGYELPVPEGADGEFAKQAAGWMHEAGIPVDAAKVLAQKWNEHYVQAQKDYEQQRQQQDEADLATLKKEWGGQYEANNELGRRAFKAFPRLAGVAEVISQAKGSAETLRIFQEIGKHLGEGSLAPDASANNQSAAPDPLGDMAKRMYPNM